MLDEWDRYRDVNMVPISLSSRRFLRRGQHFLVLNGEELWVAYSTMPVSRSVTFGFPNFKFGASFSYYGLVLEAKVSNMLDAATKVAGKNFNFWRFPNGF